MNHIKAHIFNKCKNTSLVTIQATSLFHKLFTDSQDITSSALFLKILVK